MSDMVFDSMMADLDLAIAHVERLTVQHARIAAVLATFAASPLSISSVQPLLALNDELNPKVTK